ncbi:MAG TPA: NAD(P)H-binding protein [Phycisphaerales bacterium]|nr:NAD(P)H-binding protein [Phycisphaerales bacterium]
MRTLTNSRARPNPFGDQLEIHPLAFGEPRKLVESLRGAATLINTYWVRFNYKSFSLIEAVRNTKVLFEAAREAGVKRIVHVSILKPDEGRGLAYYEGKLELERALRELGVAHTILRPGVLFGRGDILVNNIAWSLRHLPVFGVFGDGRYKLAPLHVEDFATIAADAARSTAEHEVIDCHGPQTFEYRELARTLAGIMGIRRVIVPVPPMLGWAMTKLVDPFVRDVIVTREEVVGLMHGLLWSELPSRGKILLTEWATEHRDRLGREYASEVGRRR